jgi:hypothetical protein
MAQNHFAKPVPTFGEVVLFQAENTTSPNMPLGEVVGAR